MLAGRTWLAAQIRDDLIAAWPTDSQSLKSLLLQVLAITAATPHEQRQPELAAFLDRLVTEQSPNGRFLAGHDDLSLTWFAVAILSQSRAVEHRAAVDRATAALREYYVHQRISGLDRAGAGSTSVDRALKFLRGGSIRKNDMPSIALSPTDFEASSFAGGLLPRRAAREFILKNYGELALTQAFSLPELGSLQNLHLAARVLASYRSPRIRTQPGDPRLWPQDFRDMLLQQWDLRSLAPTAAARNDTAAALLLLDVLEPWRVIVDQEVLDSASEAEPTRYAVNDANCAECHRRLNPGLVYQWQSSTHSAKDVGCAGCHGTNHSQIFREKGRVSPRVCGKCHEAAWQEFAGSPHALAEQTLLESALFAATPQAQRDTCHACHAVGRRHTDGSQGSCNYCHTGHRFMASDAIEPGACTGCHTGDDYPQDLAYWASKHGAVYRKTRDTKVSPTCSTCHHPGGTHRGGVGITIGGIGVGGILGEDSSAPIPMQHVSAADFAQGRATMVEVCTQCHSSRFSEEELRRADRLKAYGTSLLAEAAEILRELHGDGLIAALGDAGELELGGHQVRISGEIRGAELLNRFYDMWRYHYTSTWKGAYHSSPTVANLKSRPGLENDLDWIRHHAAKLRKHKDESP